MLIVDGNRVIDFPAFTWRPSDEKQSNGRRKSYVWIGRVYNKQYRTTSLMEVSHRALLSSQDYVSMRYKERLMHELLTEGRDLHYAVGYVKYRTHDYENLSMCDEKSEVVKNLLRGEDYEKAMTRLRKEYSEHCY